MNILCELRWCILKPHILKKVIYDIDKLSSERKLKHDTVIYIIERLLAKHASDLPITINPLNTKIAVTCILEDYEILRRFREEKKLIKKILK